MESKLQIRQLTLISLQPEPPSSVRLLEFEQEIRRRQAFLKGLYREVYDQSLAIQDLIPLHPFAYRGPGWFSSYQSSY